MPKPVPRDEAIENVLAFAALLWALQTVSFELAVGVAGAGVLAFNLYRSHRRGT